MKLSNIIKMVPVLGMVIIAASSCDKATTYDPIGGTGSTYVKITGGGTPAEFELKSIDFVPTPSIIGVDVQRMVPNSSELTKTMTVVVKIDTAMVTAFNTANGSSYVKIPNSWYAGTPNNPKAGGEDGTFTMTFKPGEFAKNLEILIPNATLLDPSTTYAIGLTIQSVDADGKISESKSKVIGIGAKNIYDGVYTVTGTFVDNLNAAFTGNYPRTYSLITSGANTCRVCQDINGELVPGYLFLNAGAGTYFGSYGLTISFNPATKAISDLHNYYGNPANPANGVGNPALGTGAPLYASSNTRRAVLDPSGVNAVQANKDIIIKHFMLQSSATPGVRSSFDETWKYTGPR
jgi:Domain of unknown function (DUF1735)